MANKDLEKIIELDKQIVWIEKELKLLTDKIARLAGVLNSVVTLRNKMRSSHICGPNKQGLLEEYNMMRMNTSGVIHRH